MAFDAIRSAVGPTPDWGDGNIGELFLAAIDEFEKPDALKYKRSGAWYGVSHRKLYEDVKRLALGLELLHVRRGDRVALLSENRPEWFLADMACAMRGIISVPLYPNLQPDQIEFMLRDSGAKVVLLSNADQLEKVRQVRSGLETLEHVVMFEQLDSETNDALTLDRLLALAGPELDRHPDPEYRERALAIDPHDILTILYTSGTTGRPKGVILTHNNLVSNVRGVLVVLRVTSDDVLLSHLPLSHIFERTAGQYAAFSAGATICYAESISAVGDNMSEVSPTIMVSVPRGFEKMYEAIQRAAREGGTLRGRLVTWASKVGDRWARRKLAGRPPGLRLAISHRLADGLVYTSLRKRTGGKIRFFVSGGAALNHDIARLFFAARLPILEGYGLTETSPVIAVNRLGSQEIGSVGPPIPGVEVAIAEDGEILTRGAHVMKSYHHDPEATAEAVDPEGWFHTGDLGKLDAQALLYVLDRKKELIKTSGGKYVAPQPIEIRVLANPYVRQVVLVGERRKFPALLILPDYTMLASWARQNGIAFEDPQELTLRGSALKHLEAEILGPLEDLPRYERPKKIAILPRELSVEGSELTPTLKVKRRVVDAKYAELIDSIYE